MKRQLASVALAGLFVLFGCGSDDSPAPSGGGGAGGGAAGTGGSTAGAGGSTAGAGGSTAGAGGSSSGKQFTANPTSVVLTCGSKTETIDFTGKPLQTCTTAVGALLFQFSGIEVNVTAEGGGKPAAGTFETPATAPTGQTFFTKVRVVASDFEGAAPNNMCASSQTHCSVKIAGTLLDSGSGDLTVDLTCDKLAMYDTSTAQCTECTIAPTQLHFDATNCK